MSAVQIIIKPHFKMKNVSCQIIIQFQFIEIKCQFLNYYKAPFNLKKNGRCQKEKCQLSNVNNKT